MYVFPKRIFTNTDFIIIKLSEMKRQQAESVTKEEWYTSLTPQGKYIAECIFKYHDYFSKKDKKLKYLVQVFDLSVLFFSMCTTIVLGLNGTFPESFQLNAGLVLSAFITFMTATAAFLNLEKYWMRNITKHIDINILRDHFIFDVKASLLDESKLNEYLAKLTKIQNDNIEYWKKNLRK